VYAAVTDHDSRDAKAALRQRVRRTRDELDAAHRAAAAERIAATLDREIFATLPAGAIVGLYAAIRSEVDSAPIAARVQARGLRSAYPRVLGPRTLGFSLATVDDLAPGAMGIPEPAADRPRVQLAEIAAFIVPGLAFDATGARLGWGGGYYDHTLAGAPHARRIGVAFASQLVASVPTDNADQRVHMIVTEVALHRCA
jgi:5-formyltetrahydrofolate cyclo-ligase